MTGIAAALWNDEAGFVVSSELAMVGTLGVIGMVVGMSEVAGNVNQEMDEIGAAVGQLNQTYAVAGTCGHRAFVGGSAFLDRADCEDADLDVYTLYSGYGHGNLGYSAGLGLSACGTGCGGIGYGGIGGPIGGRQVIRTGNARYQRNVFVGPRDDVSACIATAPCPPAAVAPPQPVQFAPTAAQVALPPQAPCAPAAPMPACAPVAVPCEPCN